MIEWMQRHKKYLVITIWISVIALVFAGMVGWNPSGFSLSGDNVAKVGKIKISSQEFQTAYERTFNEYNQLLGGNLDAEQAKNFKIDAITLQQLIQKAKLQNFALDLGLRVSDEEVKNLITSNQAFQKDGVFDKEIYREVLKNNHLNVKFFEQSIKDSLLIQKLLELFPTSITSLEQSSIGGTIALTDTIEYKVLNPQPIKKQIKEEEVHNFWEKNKEKYINYTQVNLLVTKVEIDKQDFSEDLLQNFYNENKTLYLDENGQLLDFNTAKKQVIKDYQKAATKEKALRLRSKFKKDELNELTTQNLHITLDSTLQNKELFDLLQAAKEGDIITPVLFSDNEYIVGKITKVTPQTIKDYTQAKTQALEDLKKEVRLQELETFANSQLKSFKGISTKINNLGTVKFENIDEKSSAFIIHHIFNSKEKYGVIMTDNKAVLYRITKQVLPDQAPNNIIPLVQNIKTQYISNALLEYITKLYSVKIYNQQISQ